LLAAPALALAAPVQAQLCDGSSLRPSADGRVLGHLPYGDVPADELGEAPDGFAVRGVCRLRRDALPDLGRMLADAGADPATGGTLRGLSCHRSLTRQQDVFCREQPGDPADRAMSVAPPGHSEHTSGYALDFAVRPSNGCRDAEACMAASAPYRWLVANARRYGFEQSFPAGNAQGVKWEPWHWRWVGTAANAPGAPRARSLFARARTEFPADPAVVTPPPVVPTIRPPEPPPPAPPAPTKRGRRR